MAPGCLCIDGVDCFGSCLFGMAAERREKDGMKLVVEALEALRACMPAKIITCSPKPSDSRTMIEQL